MWRSVIAIPIATAAPSDTTTPNAVSVTGRSDPPRADARNAPRRTTNDHGTHGLRRRSPCRPSSATRPPVWTTTTTDRSTIPWPCTRDFPPRISRLQAEVNAIRKKIKKNRGKKYTKFNPSIVTTKNHPIKSIQWSIDSLIHWFIDFQNWKDFSSSFALQGMAERWTARWWSVWKSTGSCTRAYSSHRILFHVFRMVKLMQLIIWALNFRANHKLQLLKRFLAWFSTADTHLSMRSTVYVYCARIQSFIQLGFFFVNVNAACSNDCLYFFPQSNTLIILWLVGRICVAFLRSRVSFSAQESKTNVHDLNKAARWVELHFDSS